MRLKEGKRFVRVKIGEAQTNHTSFFPPIKNVNIEDTSVKEVYAFLKAALKNNHKIIPLIKKDLEYFEKEFEEKKGK